MMSIWYSMHACVCMCVCARCTYSIFTQKRGVSDMLSMFYCSPFESRPELGLFWFQQETIEESTSWSVSILIKKKCENSFPARYNTIFTYMSIPIWYMYYLELLRLLTVWESKRLGQGKVPEILQQ